MAMNTAESSRNRKDRFHSVSAISPRIWGKVRRRFGGGAISVGMRLCVPAAEIRMATNITIAATSPYQA